MKGPMIETTIVNIFAIAVVFLAFIAEINR